MLVPIFIPRKRKGSASILAKPASKRRANALSVFVTLHFVVRFMFRVLLVLPVLFVRHLIGSHLVLFHHAVIHIVIVLHGLRSLLCCERGDS